jgi:hypothetical protein
MAGIKASGQVAACSDLPSRTVITRHRSLLFLLFPDALSVSVGTLPLTEHANQYIALSDFARIHNPPSLRLHCKPVPEIEVRSFSQA